MPDYILEWGLQIVLAVQALGAWLAGPMNALTFTGNAEFYLALMPAIYWCWERRLGLQIGIALMISLVANEIFKLAFHDPRPYWFDARVQLLGPGESSFGVPSGHAQHTLVVWSLIAYHIHRWWAWLAAICITALVGFSRIYLGVHFPTDLLVAWLIGATVVVLVIRFERPVLAWLQSMTPAQQIAWLFLLSLVMVAAGLLISRTVDAGWQLPTAWIDNARARDPDAALTPLAMRGTIIAASAVFGFTSSAILQQAHGGFDAGGVWPRRVIRYLVGIAGAVVLWRGLDIAFALLAPDDSLLGYLLRYIRYATVSAWIGGIAPWLFIRLGLAETMRVTTQQPEVVA